MNTTKTILRWFGVLIFSLLTIGAITESVSSTIAFATLAFISVPNNTYNQTIKDKITNRGFMALVIVLGLTGLFAIGPTLEESTEISNVPVLQEQKIEPVATTTPDVTKQYIEEAKETELETKEIITPVIKNEPKPEVTKTEIAQVSKPVVIESTPEPKTKLYSVVSVVDGDTVKVSIDGAVESIRIIGIDTPEIGSRLECFGNEAKVKAKQLLSDKQVFVELDPSQGERDKYGRLLAYLVIDNATDFGEQMILQGYAHEYTYNLPYKNQSTYKSAETYARTNNLGLWANGACDTYNQAQNEPEPAPAPITINNNGECLIKGNISSKDDEKIYHVPGQQAYSRTKISIDKGERWFCTEQEALDAGWRKALQ